MPVLAEEAVGRATGIKDSQIVISGVLATLANPVCNAIGRERVTIPV
jgi:hypothetical protein